MERKTTKKSSFSNKNFSFETKLETITKYCFGLLFASLSVILIFFSINFAISKMSIDPDIKIVITGNKILKTEDLANNLIEMLNEDKLTSTMKLKQNLESLSWVGKAEVKNDYGRSLVVNITEKSAVVIAKFSNQYYFLDSDAQIITKASSLDSDLLYIKGKPNKDQLSSILTISNQINSSNFKIDKLEILKSKSYEVLLSNQTKIILSQNEIGKELTKLSVIFTDGYFIKQLLPRIAVIDLRYDKALSLKFKSDIRTLGSMS